MAAAESVKIMEWFYWHAGLEKTRQATWLSGGGVSEMVEGISHLSPTSQTRHLTASLRYEQPLFFAFCS